MAKNANASDTFAIGATLPTTSVHCFARLWSTLDNTVDLLTRNELIVIQSFLSSISILRIPPLTFFNASGVKSYLSLPAPYSSIALGVAQPATLLASIA